MSDLKVVDQIHNWFDVLVVLADSEGTLSPAANALVQEFAGRRSVYIVQPDQADGPCKSDRSGPGVLWIVHCPRQDGAEQAERIWRFLRDTHVRRPLIWVEHPAFEHFLEQVADDFKVFHLTDLNQATISRSLGRCDLIVAESNEAVAALASAEFRGSVAHWAPPFDYVRLDRQICTGLNALLSADKSLNILVLYDDTFTHIKPIQEHLQAFSKHSKHRYFYFPARLDSVIFGPFKHRWPEAWDFSDYDAVVWHYCLRAAHTDNVDPLVAEKLAQYDGLKILFIQDDYDTTLTTWDWIEKVGIQLVMTCIPAHGIQYAFPDWKPGTVEFLQTHTGFVPEDDMDRFIVPMEERQTHLAYRGRTLSYRYGSLGREKYMLGVRMKELAAERGVPADIAVDDAGRIYGDDWYRFTAGARATLASETGSHVFDFDGTLLPHADAAQAAGVPYDDYFAEFLAEKEQHVHMNQVSPRIFEAVRLKTALVCFEGEYSGAVLPDEHYIPLKKDFSNADEVFARLEDVEFLKAMTERAYRDVIESGKWSHAAFVRRFDGIIDSRLLRSARKELLTATIARRERGGELVAVPRRNSFEFSLNSGVLRDPMRRAEFADFMGDIRAAEREGSSSYRKPQPRTPPSEGVVVRRLAAEGFYAAEDGDVRLTPNGVQIWTAKRPWHTGGYSVMDLSSIDFRDQHVWVRAVFTDVVGEPRLGTYNPEVAGPADDTVIEMTDGKAVVYSRVQPGASNIHVRNGGTAGVTSCVLTDATVIIAPAYEEGVMQIIQDLAIAPRGDLWSEDSLTERSLQRARPHQPPADSRVIATYPGARLAAGSGTVKVEDTVASLTIGGQPWTYAAFMDLDLSGLNPEDEYCWVRITASQVGGRLLAGAWWRSGNEIVGEKPLERTIDAREFILPVEDPRFGAIMFREGVGDEDATIVLHKIEVLACSRYPRVVADLVTRMAARSAPAEDAEAAVAKSPPAEISEQEAQKVEAPKAEANPAPLPETVASEAPGRLSGARRWRFPFKG